MKIFFPEVKFNNPLAGEFALKKKLLYDIEVPDDWGIETALAIDVTMKGYKTLEIDFKGAKKHNPKPVEDLVIMSRQIINTFISKIIEYNRMLKGIGKTKQLPKDWLEEIKREVAESTNGGIYKGDIDQYFSKMDESINRISSLENL